jgi:glucosamine 6-phosphate synthetase-like amidotransferase/phosphosugar isomerase protein
MCGIFGYIGKKIDASDKVLHGLKQLEYRGYEYLGYDIYR